MIYVNVRGRVGNQMFIYAMARALQLKLNQDIVFNYVSYKNNYNSNIIDLKNFNIASNIYFETEKPLPWYANSNNVIIKFFRHYFPNYTYEKLSKHNIFLWLGESYKDIKINLKKDIYIDGYWQSPKYFNEYKGYIKKELIPNVKLSDKSKQMLDVINSSESICVSIRRGDYVNNPKFKKKYYVCDEKYIEKSIDKANKLIPNGKWIVFSDDIDWVKNNVKFPSQVVFQHIDITPLETLYLMSKCKNFIISNSSFSWWGQYLSNNKNKIVIAPSKWYVDNRCSDIMEDTWIKISV